MKTKNNGIEHYYENNRFLQLLLSSRKYKELFCTQEALVSLVCSILTTTLIFFVHSHNKVEVFNEVFRNLLIESFVGLLGILGFIVGGLAILSGTISNKAVANLNKKQQVGPLVNILFSFYFLGSIVGICIFSFVSMYLVSYLAIAITPERLIGISFILSYLFWFIVVYSVTLLGTCLKIFLLNFKLSEDGQEPIE